MASELQAIKPRMDENGAVGPSDSRYAKASDLYNIAGYGPRDSPDFKEIHCQKDNCRWMSNGFMQCFSRVDGRKCRVLIYFPTQELQPHKHDLDEDFMITHGAVDLWTWEEDGSRRHRRLGKGDRFGVPAGVTHCLRADRIDGLVFHELVAEDTFSKRSTEFHNDHAGERPVACEMPSVFADKTVLVTGANRGLGLGYAQFLVAAGAKVVACCRDPSKAEALAKLSPRPVLVPLDVSDEVSVQGLVARLAELEIHTIDYLINNAGISSPNHPNDPIVSASPSVIRDVFNVNVIGTILVTQECLPLLRAGAAKCVVNMSSILASLDKCQGTQGNFHGIASYRMSRVANNMAMRCFGGELREEGFVFISMSPGHVDTDMGSSGGRAAPLTVGQSVAGMLDTIAHLAIDDNGKFFQHDGTELPW